MVKHISRTVPSVNNNFIWLPAAYLHIHPYFSIFSAIFEGNLLEDKPLPRFWKTGRLCKTLPPRAAPSCSLNIRLPSPNGVHMLFKATTNKQKDDNNNNNNNTAGGHDQSVNVSMATKTKKNRLSRSSWLQPWSCRRLDSPLKPRNDSAGRPFRQLKSKVKEAVTIPVIGWKILENNTWDRNY